MSYDVFISYRRDGGEHTAKIIRDNLSDFGYQVFFDVESLGPGNFNTELYSVIDECSDFILVLSPGALDRCSDESDWVRREVEYALSKNKNVVPVLLRDFKFDCELPKSMQTLPQMSGIEASSEFFDAFIKRLQKFLKAKPSLFRRIIQNSVFRKTVPLFISLILITGIIFGIKFGVDRFSDSYPSTRAEENLTQEVIHCVGMNLTKIELVAQSAFDAMNVLERYLYTDAGVNTELDNRLAVCRKKLNDIEEDKDAPDAAFINRLYDSPFSAADLTAMHGEVGNFKNEWLKNIDFLEYISGDMCPFPKETKLEIINNYKKYLEETLNMHSCAINMLLVGITDKDALGELYAEILPSLVCIPLNSQNWSADIDILKNKEEEIYNKLQSIINSIYVLTGDINAYSY